MSRFSTRFQVFLVVFLACSLLGTGCSSDIHATPEALGKAFLEVLTSGDEAGIAQFFPGEEDWESMAKLTKVPEKEYDNFKKDFQRRVSNSQENEGSRFQILQERAKEAGLDLSKAVFVKLESREYDSDEGLKLADVHLFFTVDGDRQIIRLNQIGRLDRGWFLNRIPNWDPS